MSSQTLKKELEKRIKEISTEKELLEGKNKKKKNQDYIEKINKMDFKIDYLKDQLKFF